MCFLKLRGVLQSWSWTRVTNSCNVALSRTWWLLKMDFLAFSPLFWGCELFSGGYMRAFIQDAVLSIILTPKFLSLCSFLQQSRSVFLNLNSHYQSHRDLLKCILLFSRCFVGNYLDAVVSLWVHYQLSQRYGIDRLSHQIKMLESYDLSNQFKTHSQKQEENRRGWLGEGR